jgi:hypothetical protein
MKRRIILSLVFLLISGCGTSSPNPSDAAINSTQIPVTVTQLATNTPRPTETPQPVPSRVPTATEEAEKIIFQDDFQNILANDWQWLNENPANWSLQKVPGSLQIMVQPGYVNFKNASNVLLMPAPEGNFQIETMLNVPESWRTHFAGLLLYESEKNFIQAGHAYCNPIYRCVGEGIYLEEFNQGYALLDPYVAQEYSGTKLGLRLVYKDGRLTFLSSPNGTVWYRINESVVGFKILQVGLAASQNLEDPSAVTFDYFQIKSLK